MKKKKRKKMLNNSLIIYEYVLYYYCFVSPDRVYNVDNLCDVRKLYYVHTSFVYV